MLAAISNTDYEGEIKNHGDKVNIRTKPTIQINDYQADMPLAAQRPAAATVTLAIDKGKYFNCILDDVMEIQSDINMMSMWSDDAGEQMKIVIDKQVLGANATGGILHQSDAAQSRRRRWGDHWEHQSWRDRHAYHRHSAQSHCWSDRDHRYDPAHGPGARRAEHPGDRAVGRHADLGRHHGQEERTP